MKTIPESTPPQVVPALTDFESPEAWQRDIVKRLTAEICRRLNDDLNRRPYMYEIDQTHHFSDLDSEVLEKILLGRVCDAECDVFNESNEDYLYELDTGSIREEAENLFGEWDEEIEALAKAVGEDPDVLTEEWLDSEDFSRSELQIYLHSYDHTYHGAAAASAELPFELNLNPENDDFWKGLTFFRINANDFLAMAKSEITNEHGNTQGILADQDLAIWGLDARDNDEDEPATAAEIYEQKFLMLLEEEKKFRLQDLNEFKAGNEVINAYELFAYVKANAYQCGTEKITTHLQLCLGPQTIKGFSTQCNRHDFFDKCIPLTITSGYLSPDSWPGFAEKPEFIRLRKSIELPCEAINISKDSPEKGEDGLWLPIAEQLYADLYEALVIEPSKQKVFDDKKSAESAASDDVTQNLFFEKAIKLLAKAPRWAVQSIDCNQSFPQFSAVLQAYLDATNGPDAQSDLDRTLLERIESLGQERFNTHEQKKVTLLLKLGAQGNLVNAVGANAFQIAVNKRLPLQLLEALHQVTLTPAAALPDGRNAFDLAVRAEDRRGRPWNTAGKQDQIARLAWFLDRGIAPGLQAIDYPKPGVLQQIQRIDDAPLTIAVLDSLTHRLSSASVQAIKNRMLLEASILLREPMVAQLLADGADINAVETLWLAGKPLEKAIEDSPNYNKADEVQVKCAESCMSMVQSVRLRAIAMALIAEMEDCAPAPFYRHL